MPLPYLEEESKNIKRRLLRSTLITGACLVAGIGLTIPAFSVKGTKFDSLLFCFKPKVVYAPELHKYCQGKKIRRGIAWIVAEEHGNNLEFKSKVKLLKKIPAQNPSAAYYGLVSALFFGGAYLFFKEGTTQLEGKFADVVRRKLIELNEGELEQNKHLGVKAHAAAVEEDYLKQQVSRAYQAQNYMELDEHERTYNAEEYAKLQKLKDADIERQLATLKAETAEKQEKEAKHIKEVEKLNKTASVKDSKKAADANEEARHELESKLKEHEDGWLYTVVNSSKPVFLVGPQGSWKSYCASTIALSRWCLKGQKLISIVDPHFNKNMGESWKQLIALEPEVYGGAQDWAEVGVGIQAGFSRWNERTLKDEPLTSIWDEQTNWVLHDECAQLAKEFIGRVISDPRKANESPIVITHSFTNQGTGGGGGFAAAREEGILQLRLNADNDMRPLFKGRLIGFKDQDGELVEDMKITIPKEWFNPKAIAEMFAKS